MTLTTLCYIKRDDSYLLLHRTKKKDDINEGKWIAPGGHVEEGETPYECVLREVKEETGLTLGSFVCRGIVHFISPSEEEEMFIYSSEDFSGEVTECDEGDLKWVPCDRIFELPMWEGDRRFLKPLLNGDRFIRITLRYDKDGVLAENCDPILTEADKAVLNLHEYPGAGYKKALIVTGASSARFCGALSDVKSELALMGMEYALFEGVEENPSVDTVMAAAEVGKKAGVDIVIGIGGGSPMDAAKAAALMIYNSDRTADFLYKKGNDGSSLPVICIPTTCGTGSEATGVAVLSRPKLHQKGSIPYRIMPMLGLLDAAYLRKAPASVIRNTAIDALAHLCESYVNTKATPHSRAVAAEGLHIWGSIKDSLLSDEPFSDDILKELLCASAIAGIAISETGTAIPHALSYTLTAELGIPHGPAVGYFLSGYLKRAGEEGARALAMSGFSSSDELKNFYAAVCGVPEVSYEYINMAAETVASNPAKTSLCPFDVDSELLRSMAF